MATKAYGEAGAEHTICGVPVDTAVVEAIADARSVDPTDLEFRLYEVIDPEALDRLCSGGGDVVVEFSVEDHRVRISGDTVTVTPR